jgi:hypothetical protein
MVIAAASAIIEVRDGPIIIGYAERLGYGRTTESDTGFPAGSRFRSGRESREANFFRVPAGMYTWSGPLVGG